MDTTGLPSDMLGPMDSMGAETGSAAEVAGGLDEEAMLIEIKLRNQCKLQRVEWDNRDDCQVNISLVTVCSSGSDQSLRYMCAGSGTDTVPVLR